ncbi:AIG1-like protein [Artemisia annua]|uniref:AIG1-like protein n=1 Tax=Artemisia annua TaxID=35608 RepID=A0A2U1LRR4_ARTAN|nr:AIG1-like protein [Artemisia annua]
MMENGANKAELVVGEINSDVMEDRGKGLGNDESKSGVEGALDIVDVEETVFVGGKDGSGENGGVVEKIEDAFETPRATVTVTEAVSVKVNDEESTSGNTIEDESVGIEKNDPVDVAVNDDGENLAENIKEKNVSDDISSDHQSGLEGKEVVNDGDDEAKVISLAEVGEEKNASDATSSDQPTGLEANEVVNDGDGEVEVLNLVQQAIDVESTSNNDERDQASELETKAAVDSKNDEAEVVGVAVNENNEGLKGILEDVPVVNKKAAGVIIENSENGVSSDAALDETVIHDRVNGDSVDHRTQPDGEISGEVNGDVSSQLHEDVNGNDTLVTDDKDDDSVKQNDEVESTTNDLLNVQNEPKVEQNEEVVPKSFEPSSGSTAIHEPEVERRPSFDDKLSESVADSSEIREQKDDKPLNKEPESRPVIGVSSTAKSVTPTPVPNPKDDPKPKETPTPNSRPNTTPTLRPFLAPAPTRPAGLGRGAPLLEPAQRVVQSQANGNVSPPQNQVVDEPTNGEAEENDETREKLQMIRVKFLRLARRLGQTPHNVVVAQVLYRLGLAEQLRGRTGGRVAAFSFERASAMAEQLEAAGQEPLEFSCTIMVLGKTGVGKSATINSIFDEVKFGTDAFQLGTKKVQDVVGTVQGIKVRVIDTPGLLPSWADQRKNQKILQSVKKFIQKSPPDIVLYLDRLDMQSRDDMPLLRTITDIFGQSIWFNAIVVLTHAASAPPEGPNGTATSYDMFVTQRSHVVQQAIRQAAGDMRLMNPVSLVENHSACRTNRNGQRVLPNGQVWKPHLLLLSFASKILVEANMLLKLQDSPPGKPFAARSRAPPLPYILSTLLQSRPQLKLPQEHKAQKKSYYDELEYREKLFMKKQLKEEKKRRKMMKKMAEAAKNFPAELTDNNVDEDSNAAATVPVAVQDMTLPALFDADNPTHRYRALDSANQWLIRPVLDPHGWDHDVGYEGINVEHLLALKEKIPVSFSGQVTKDKKDANLQMEVSSAMKHGKSKSTTVAFDMQTVGKEMSYSLRSETRFINYRKNKASAGISATYFGDTLTGGVKFEDKLMINKRGELVVAGGAVIGRGDVAYGGSLEATLRDKDFPLGRFLSTIGLSVMDWHGDLALGWNAQSQIPIGRTTNLIGRVNLNNKGSGQVSVRLNSSDQLQIALAALVPLDCNRLMLNIVILVVMIAGCSYYLLAWVHAHLFRWIFFFTREPRRELDIFSFGYTTVNAQRPEPDYVMLTMIG